MPDPQHFAFWEAGLEWAVGGARGNSRMTEAGAERVGSAGKCNRAGLRALELRTGNEDGEGGAVDG